MCSYKPIIQSCMYCDNRNNYNEFNMTVLIEWHTLYISYSSCWGTSWYNYTQRDDAIWQYATHSMYNYIGWEPYTHNVHSVVCSFLYSSWSGIWIPDQVRDGKRKNFFLILNLAILVSLVAKFKRNRNDFFNLAILVSLAAIITIGNHTWCS